MIFHCPRPIHVSVSVSGYFSLVSPNTKSQEALFKWVTQSTCPYLKSPLFNSSWDLTGSRNLDGEVRRSYDHLISSVGFPLLVGWHLCTEAGLFYTKKWNLVNNKTISSIYLENKAYRSAYEFTKGTPYLPLACKQWSVFCECFEDKRSCFSEVQLHPLYCTPLYEKWTVSNIC